MKSDAKDPKSYLASIEPERRAHLETLRALVKRVVPKATEGMVWGMLGYAIDGRPFAGLAAQKSYLSLYLMDLYTQPSLQAQHVKALSHLKMGKSCINFHDVAELPLDTIEAILREAPKVVVAGGTMAKVPTAATGAKKAPAAAKKAAAKAPAPAKKAAKAKKA